MAEDVIVVAFSSHRQYGQKLHFLLVCQGALRQRFKDTAPILPRDFPDVVSALSWTVRVNKRDTLPVNNPHVCHIRLPR